MVVYVLVTDGHLKNKMSKVHNWTIRECIYGFIIFVHIGHCPSPALCSVELHMKCLWDERDGFWQSSPSLLRPAAFMAVLASTPLLTTESYSYMHLNATNIYWATSNACLPCCFSSTDFMTTLVTAFSEIGNSISIGFKMYRKLRELLKEGSILCQTIIYFISFPSLQVNQSVSVLVATWP